MTRQQAELRASKASRDFGVLIAVTGFLCLLGLVMVLSASSITSLGEYGTVWGIFARQAMWMAFGAVAFIVGMRAPYAFWRNIRIPFMLVALGLLVAVLVPHVGQVAGGSSRWIGSGAFRIQPSELMKLALAVYGADLVARREDPRAPAREQWRSLVMPMLFILAIAGILIYKQPDLGTAMVICCIAFAQLHAGGVRMRLLVATLATVVAIGAVAVLASPYQRSRLTSLTSPFAHAGTSGYQLVQSLVALGSGRLTGTGAGTSVVKWGYLPNAHTDFIFAVIGNELGLIGGLLVIVLFALFAWYGVRVASRAPDRFSSLLAVGITCWVVSQATMNIGGVIGVLPITGIPLPFVSFGGSSLVVVMLASGILAGISRTTERRARAMATRR
jgi:cell division protein FtsW